MTDQKAMQTRMNILALSLPILAENLLRFFFSFADMAMLSYLTIDGVHYGDDAVAAVGLINSLVFFIIIFHIMVNSGSSIVITQYNGANRKDKATNTVVSGVILSFCVGIFISLAMFFLAEPIIKIYGLSAIRQEFAVSYLRIYGSLSFGMALNSIFSTILRSYGYSREPMIINICANLVNVCGNYCFIFGAFGFPQWGVKGVALATIFSQTLAALFIFIMILRKKDIDFPCKRFLLVRWVWIKEILKIGIPNGGELLSYNVAQIVMNYFVAQMEPSSLPAYNYAFLFALFILYFGVSIGQGTQIIVSYLVGSKQLDKAYQSVNKIFMVSFFLALFLAAIVSLARHTILDIFPMDPEVLAKCSALIIFTLLLEPGRTFNLIFISGLKGAGDITFPVRIGIISMWGIGVVFAYLWGNIFALGIIGIWIGIAMDEWMRGIIMFSRWRSRIWEKKILVH